MKEELKQAIEEAYRISSSNSWIQKELQHSKRLAVELAMSDISILRHADPEIMKQAGWVREEELNDIIEAAKTALHTLDCIEFTRDSGTISNKLQNLIDKHTKQ